MLGAECWVLQRTEAPSTQHSALSTRINNDMRSLSLVVSLLLAPVFLFAQTSKDLVVGFGPLPNDPNSSAVSVQLTLSNLTAVAVSNVAVDITLDARRGAISATHHPSRPADQWSCENVTAQHVRCRADIAQGPNQYIPLVVTVDPGRPNRFVLTAQATWASGTSERVSWNSYIPREVLVTNTLDSGPGSLRAAIEEANGDVAPTLLHFAIDESVIRLLTPLPPITSADFAIDGYRRDGIDPPLIEIDGSLLASGTGLDIRGEGDATVSHLAIGGFPQDAIAISRSGKTFVANNIIDNNGNRGISMSSEAAGVYVTGNWIRSNGRSAVFIMGAKSVELRQNFIDANGASGLFAGPGTRDVFISENTITNNAHFGIAVARDASGVRLWSTNRILYNGILPLDHGLDGFDGYASAPDAHRTPAPRLDSVTYDAATDTTTVRGTLDVPDPSKVWTITLYSPDFVWTDLPLQRTTVKDNMFTFSWKGRTNFPTSYSAYADSSDLSWSTSEFAEPIVDRP